ncbi:putative nuclease HARBI1 [Thalassophryne amazonica]|uniref:putative nuclease HARBI1 n=1 Tax=Thalassophryne amazonica TaxID=390379 RepID=UPI001471B086|nr:putative nuclease HARBI1 [Thalassophryne amazonica]
MLNSRAEALKNKKRCLYYLAAAALLLEEQQNRAALLLQEQEKNQKEQVKEEGITPTRKRKARTVWVRDWLTRRHHFGHYDQLLTELHKEDPKGYKNYLRVPPDLFQEMVEKLTPHLEKKVTFMREPLDVGLKLATTLRFLSTGNSYTSLQHSFRVDLTTICKFLPEVCKAIIEVYKDKVLRCPKTEEGWKEVAEGFSSRWNYYNCLGAVDGKHVAVKKSGSFYYNYKGFHSIVLMAVVDAGYKFLYVDVGAEGGASDGEPWKNCTLHEAVEDKRAGLPGPAPLPNDDKPVPYHFIADDAFALRTWLMKPFSHHSQNHREIIYSCRLSRARCVVENTFGILSQRFRCFSTTMQQNPETISLITMCACVLHNLILSRYPLASTDVDHEDSATHNLIPGAWREVPQMEGLMPLSEDHIQNEAKEQREYLSHYYSSPAGAVPWQERMVTP